MYALRILGGGGGARPPLNPPLITSIYMFNGSMEVTCRIGFISWPQRSNPCPRYTIAWSCLGLFLTKQDFHHSSTDIHPQAKALWPISATSLGMIAVLIWKRACINL